jgi:hypothetical protein
MTRLQSLLAASGLILAMFAPAIGASQTPDAPAEPPAIATPDAPVQRPAPAPTPQPIPPPEPSQFSLNLSAILAAGQKPAQTGLEWRVFQERAEPDGSHTLVAKSSDPTPSIRLPEGDYVVHVAYGLASAMKRVSLRGGPSDQRLTLNAGALRIAGVLGDGPIPNNRLKIAVYVPERSGNEARLVVADAQPETTIRLPEGAYRIISTYLDKEGAGTTPGAAPHANATNSVLTLKLVNAPGGEALANTSFSVLTPGGDVIREMIGAFPSLVLAEGEYVVIARRDGKTFQGTFNVQSSLDRDIEVIAK